MQPLVHEEADVPPRLEPSGRGCDAPQARYPQRVSVKAARVIRWYAGLPLTIVATNSLLTGLVLSATQAAGWNDWGHYGLVLSIVPIVAWAAARWWAARSR